MLYRVLRFPLDPERLGGLVVKVSATGEEATNQQTNNKIKLM